jgi:hypothetical protein
MQVTEIYADEAGETHFRKKTIDLNLRDFAPPAAPIGVSAGEGMTTGLSLEAPPGWDKNFHPTPRRQYAILLSGTVTITVTDGTVIEAGPGAVLLLNDTDCTGHLTQVQGDRPAVFFLVGLAGDPA